MLHCTGELMVSSAVHSADAERLGVLSKVLPSSELGASLMLIHCIYPLESVSLIYCVGGLADG